MSQMKFWKRPLIGLFGVVTMREGSKQEVVGEVLVEASKLALTEIEHFLEKRPLARKRYL